LPTKQKNEKNNIIDNEIINKYIFKDIEKEEKEERKEEKKGEIDKDQRGEINEMIIEEKEQKKKKFGRKRGRDEVEGKHDKFADDNLRRKIKHIVLSEIMEFINKKIYELYNGNIGKGMIVKKLLTVNNKQKANTMIKDTQKLLDKKLGEIFSEDISSRFTNYPKGHNKMVIEKLINENDYNKRQYFINLFNLTFLETLKHFRGSIFIEELSGLSNYNEILKKYELEVDYKTFLAFYINYFELIINSKKARRPRKERDNEDNDNE
jgi:hypothetical protein